MSLTHSPKLVTNGLLMYLDAGNPKSYPGSGTAWSDIISNNNSTLTGTSFNSGGLVFNGTSDRGTVPDIDEIKLTDVTFSFIFKLDSLSTDRDLINKGTHGTNTPLLIWFDSIVNVGADIGDNNVGAISAMAYDGSASHWVATPSNVITLSQYHFLDVVYRPSTNEILIYIDGDLSQSNTKTYSGIQNNTVVTTLCVAGNSVNYWKGNMDNFRIYNYALSDVEIKQNFEALRGRFGI